MKRTHNNRPLLFCLGAFCLLAGLGTIYVRAQLDKLEFFVSATGFLCILVCFVSSQNKQRMPKVSYWRRYVLLPFIFFGLFAVLVAVNYLAAQFNWRWDLTRLKQHTLTENTSRLMKNLNEDIQLTALYVGIPPRYLEDLFREYERVSGGRIKTSIIDPLVQIGYAAQFGSVISGKEKKVVVQSATERRDVDFTEDPLTEEQLTNAIIRVTRKMRYVYFLAGHREYDMNDEEDKGLNVFVKLLEKNNIESRKLLLAMQGGIPQDCDVLVIPGPKEHLPENEQEIIQEYLEKGGDAFFLIEHTFVTTPDRPLTEEELELNPSLNSILKNWGLRIANDIVVDLASHASGDVGSPATRNYLTHKAIVKDLDYTFYIRPRSISILGKRRKTIKVAPLVLTISKEKSWGETNRELEVKYDEILDRPGPVPIAFVAWEPKEEGDLSDTRIIVFTDADFLSNAFIGQYSNAEMGLNVINWLSELDYQIFIDREHFNIERLDLTSRQKRVVVVVLFAMPLCIAATGIMVWLKQKGG